MVNHIIGRCLEGHGDFVTVYFVDELLRCYLEYDFQEKQPGKLFLTHALFREFADETDEVVGAKTFAFKEDGTILMEDQDLSNDQVEERVATFSVAENWEEYPSFGEYSRLCNEERTEEKKRTRMKGV